MTTRQMGGNAFRAVRRLVQLLVCVLLVLAVVVPVIGLASLGGSRRRNRTVQFLTPVALRLFAIAIGLRIKVSGRRSSAARVFVGNHVTYLDILTAGVGVGGVFVSRHDVQSWPIIGLFARIAGTVFLNRDSIRSAVEGSAGIIERGRQNVRMILFPEGKTTSGESVGEFRPFLFRGIAQAGFVVQPFLILYTAIGRHPLTSSTKDLVYWYDPAPPFTTHGWRVIGLPAVHVTITFLDEHVPPGEVDNDTVRRWAEGIRRDVVREKERMVSAWATAGRITTGP